MYYSTNVNGSSYLLDQVYEALEKFGEDPFLAALAYKSFNQEKIVQMTHFVATHKNNLESELKRLNLFAKKFNNEFTIDDIHCFDAASASLLKIRIGMSGVKKIFLQFCPRARRETIFHAIGNNPVSAFEYSYICRDSYQLDLFKLDGYPPYVSELFGEMECFFLLMMRAVQLCNQVIKDEKKIKKDRCQCYFLFQRFREKVLNEIADMIQWLSKDASFLSAENNPAIASRIQYGSDEAWAPIGFHKFSPQDVKYLIIKEELDKEEGQDIPQEIRKLFGFDIEEARKGLVIIKNFDTFVTGRVRENKFPAKIVRYYLDYFGLPKGITKVDAIKYINKIYTQSGNSQYQPTTYDAVFNSNLSYEDTKEFKKKFEEILQFTQNNKKVSGF